MTDIASEPRSFAAERGEAPEHGAVLYVPLNRLKKSPRNARKVPHPVEAIEERAASIAAKGVIQPLVVEPETDGEGAPTGNYLVTVGEGRRLALLLLAKRKAIKKTCPVRCVVDLENDPLEISLDENVGRIAMHPADEFEAFKDQQDRRGLSAEDIAIRFGSTPHKVRQRLRLGAVSPKLMALYRASELTLDQMMAFAVSEDHARQEQVLEQLGGHRPPYLIRRTMTEAKVEASDRRAVFVGAEAYGEAGGTILRDLFTEDGGGWFEDVALLDRLVVEKLTALADAIGEAEGWKWTEAHLDFPHAAGLARVYPHPAPRSEAEAAEMAALSAEYDALVSQWDAVEDLPPDIEARFAEIDAALDAYGDGTAYDPDDIARGGVFVVLGADGAARIERGFIRPEDQPVVEPEPEPDAPDEDGEGRGEEPGEGEGEDEPEDFNGDPAAPLPDRMVLNLTAHRTAALRDALAQSPEAALSAVVHALVMGAFYASGERATCLEIKATSLGLGSSAPGIADSRAERSITERHERWAVRLPKASTQAWAFVQGLAASELLDLLAHCASETVNALHVPWDKRPKAWAHADRLAEAVGLDMTAYWSATERSYLGGVTKAKIAEAVREGVSDEAAGRIGGLKKPDMAREAEVLLVGTGWLPSPLRAPVAKAGQAEGEPVSQDVA